VSLARLRSDEARHIEARDLLTPIYGWFTEGFSMSDLKEAKALLDGKVRNRRNLAVHQGVDEGRVAALLRTSIIAACTTYALASCLRACWMETRAGATQKPFSRRSG